MSNIKLSLRTIWNNKVLSGIHLLGLGVGIACCLLIATYLKYEWSFDRFHTKADQIYRLCELQNVDSNHPEKVAATMPLMGETLKEDYPQIIDYTRLLSQGKNLCKTDSESIYLEELVAVDKSFFDFFDFPLVTGDPKTALSQPGSMLITASVADNFFQDINPIGRAVEDERGRQMVITGILEDLPENSHIQFDGLMSLSTITQDTTKKYLQRWGGNFINTFLMLSEETFPERLEEAFPDYIEKYLGTEAKQKIQLFLQPLTAAHSESAAFTHDYFNHQAIDKKYLYLFALLGFLVLTLSIINFSNITTARSLGRSKEIGIRKLTGASKWLLVRQFLSETLVLAFLAGIIGVILAYLSLDWLAELTQRPLRFDWFRTPYSLSLLIILSLTSGFLAGIYPALVQSNFKPIQNLNAKRYNLKRGQWTFQNLLLIGQFTVALGLVLGTIIIHQQHHFLLNQELGFEKEQILVIPIVRSVDDRYKVLKERFLKNSDVLEVTGANQQLGSYVHTSSFRFKKESEQEQLSAAWMAVDENYLEFYGLSLTEGRNFDVSRSTDSKNAFIVNEAFTQAKAWTSSINQQVGFARNNELGTIIGEVKNFNFNSLHQEIMPLAIQMRDNEFYYMSVKVSPKDVANTLANLKTEWVEVMEDRPFNYAFLDEQFEQLYLNEQKIGRLTNILSLLAIVIASMGVFGLSIILIQYKIKEIGIRKVLGASAISIVRHLSRDFIKLIIIAFVIASLVAYYFMNQWLQNFAYSIDIKWWVFALAGVAAIGIALLTVSFQSVKAALANPIDSLRNE